MLIQQNNYGPHVMPTYGNCMHVYYCSLFSKCSFLQYRLHNKSTKKKIENETNHVASSRNTYIVL